MTTRAFSLIELTAVLLIMAVAAGAVTLRVRGPLGSAQMRDVAGAVVQFDRTTRVAALEQDRHLRLVVDFAANRLSRADADGRPAGGVPLQIPGRFRIGMLLVGDQTFAGGHAAINCSRRGMTPSYAMLLEGGDRRQWLVIAGLTGQAVEVDLEKDAREILAATGPRRDAR